MNVFLLHFEFEKFAVFWHFPWAKSFIAGHSLFCWRFHWATYQLTADQYVGRKREEGQTFFSGGGSHRGVKLVRD